VHRLDRDTSGILVIAKTLKAANNLAEQFKENTISKTYWAVAYGRISPLHGIFDAPIAKVERPKGGEMMAVDFKNGKKAQTTYRVIKSFSDFSWFELKPHTGRTHQLRVHLSWAGYPIRGDLKYGPKDGFRDTEKLHLHARSIKFRNVDGDMLTFVAPPPEHMVETLGQNKINWEQFA
jgi:23S rRNA pseudouridine955/2504/2580 synthase